MIQELLGFEFECVVNARLEFLIKSTGKRAAEESRAHRVTQTVRSYKEASRFFSSRGSIVRVTLDEEEVGQARITDISKKIRNSPS